MNAIRARIHQLIFNVCLISIVATLPFPFIQVNSFFVIILALNWLVEGKSLPEFSQAIKQPAFLLFVSFYLLHIIGSIYTDSIADSLASLERKLAFLVFPLILYTRTHLNPRITRLAFLTFVFVCAISSINALVNISLLSSEEWKHFYGYTGYDYRMALWNFIVVHPTYFSIYLIFSIYFLVDLYITEPNFFNSVTKKLLAFFIILIFLITIILLISRLPIVAFSFTALVSIIYLCYKKGRLLIGLTVVSVFTGLLLLTAWSIPSVRYRFLEIKATAFKPPLKLETTSTNLRVAFLLCSKEVLKENWIFGVGTGDVQKSLNSCYKSKGYSEVLYKENYDPHNQYLQSFMCLGLAGFVSLTGGLVLLFYNSYNEKNYLHMAFLILIFLCCFTESLLENNKGIVFYVLFNILLISYKPTVHRNSLE